MTTVRPAAPTTPEPPTRPAPPQLGLVGSLRFVWRQLTSMRTALFLLLLLAVAAVPGSVLPQRGVDAGAVSRYLDAHPAAGPWLDRLGGFDVYSSVWFSAIYLLLFVSLVGCVLPRARQHWRASRSRPPRAPSRLDRLPAHRSLAVDAEPTVVLADLAAALRRRRFRVEVRQDSISAERGYLRETGNLLFHLSLVVLLVAVAYGHLLGWRGDVVVPVGTTFSNTLSAYDTVQHGPWVDPEKLPPFSVQVDQVRVRFERSAAQRGAPRDFTADVTSRTDLQARPERSTVEVNQPLSLDGARVYMLGNGYAPVITVRDSTGAVVYSDPTPFLPEDGNYTSAGVVKVPGAEPKALGLRGLFLPTVSPPGSGMPTSVFPDALDPVLVLTALEGDLGLASGAPQSVYSLNVDRMTSLRSPDGDIFRTVIRPGQTVQLPGGRGSVTFDRVERFAGLTIKYDPGKLYALAAAVAAMLGLALSLFVPRRRVFVRVRPAPDAGPRTLVEVGALARGEDTGLDDEVDRALAVLDAGGPTAADHR